MPQKNVGKMKEGAKMTERVKWLTTCPVSDDNFKRNLEKASEEEVREALKIIEGHLYVKTKKKALLAALARKTKETADHEQ